CARAGPPPRAVDDGPAAGGRHDERLLLGHHPVRAVLRQLRRYVSHAAVADGRARRQQLSPDPGGAAGFDRGAGGVRVARAAVESARARTRQRGVARARCHARAARRVSERIAGDGRRRLDRRADRVRRHHHSAPRATDGGAGSPARAPGGHALPRRGPGWLRSRRAPDPPAGGAAGRHHHGDDRRALLSMAAHSKGVTRRLRLLLCGAGLQACLAAALLAAPPRRIISLVPNVTEVIYALGAGDRVVAVSSYDTYPPEVKALPNVGALLDPNVERILSLKPDLV